jgi:branched-chain amino acid transport system permease protein
MSRSTYLRGAVRAGLIGGVGIAYFCLVGMVERLDELAIVGTLFTLDWLLLLGPAALAGYVAVRPRVIAGEQTSPGARTSAVVGAASGACSGALIFAGVALTEWIGPSTVRLVFRSVSPALIQILRLHTRSMVGTAWLAVMILVAGLAGAALRTLAPLVRRAVLNGLTAVLALGLLQRIVPPALDQLHIQRRWLYSPKTLGLTVVGAVFVFVVAAGVTLVLRGRHVRELVPVRAQPGNDQGASRRRAILLALWVAFAAALLAMPYLVGPVVSRILGTVGIFLLLGLGLNIVVGYAGLLDLGYVAFFSVGAYFTAILTGGQRVTAVGFRPPAIGASLSFWEAIPIVVCIAALIGFLIGAPVLRLRGDYLAIVTLGFGEMARVIFGSTWAQSLFGGSNGMAGIPGAPLGGFDFQADPRHFYYLALLFCVIAVFISWRLQDSRIGRAWTAMREDEQVAEAMGISTVRYKLLAFAMGGAIGSIGGAIFAVSIGSLTIASFGIIVSITALAVIILGGIGSIPGVVVGGLVLIGLPGVLSELEDFQLLIYGAALIAIMILRPQGLVPNVRRTRELLESEVEQDAWVAATSTDAAAEPVAGSPG